MTFRQRIENYWYHYKWHTIIAVFFIVTFIVCLVQCSLKEKPDDCALLYINQNLTDNAANELSVLLGEYIGDYNDNGEVLYRVNNVSYSKESTVNPNYAVTNSQKLLAAVTTADYVLYIVDEHGYGYLMSDETRLFETYDFMPDKDGTAWNWRGSRLWTQMREYGLPDDLYFCIRRLSDTIAEKDPDAAQLQKQAEMLVQKLIEEN